jgi:small subunit ribosomal protein S16
VGAKNHPVFRIVVADNRSPRDGKFIEEIGTYHPEKPADNFTLNLDRVHYWVSQGAQPSHTVSSFIKKLGKRVAPSDATPATPATAPEPATA